MNQFKSGALIAIAAGSLFASACSKDNAGAQEPSPAAPAPSNEAAAPAPEGDQAVPGTPAATAPEEKTSSVDCVGINACKGQGGCHTASNACAGQNGCKGTGKTSTTEEDCKAKGGTIAKE